MIKKSKGTVIRIQYGLTPYALLATVVGGALPSIGLNGALAPVFEAPKSFWILSSVVGIALPLALITLARGSETKVRLRFREVLGPIR
jgi:cytosine/uracil/thiamine/allantoin permease